jgi:hypothetical protein|tara:strand:- start:226 stop:327 length:102 start_codon:yes stop_codon:yes gene_type:complete
VEVRHLVENYLDKDPGENLFACGFYLIDFISPL